MKNIAYKHYKGAFLYTEKKIPVPKAKEIRIQVKAISLNPVDWKIHHGDLRLAFSPFFPKTIGFDFAGIVDAVGGHTTIQAGDYVYGMLPMNYMGSAAEYIVAPEYACHVIPANISFEEAASLPLAGLTAIQAVKSQAQVSKNQKILINGASGGVGTLAVQLAHVLGAEIVAVCSTKNKDLVTSLGATHHWDYHNIRPWEENKTFDAVIDIPSNLGFWRMRKRIRWGGHYISVTPDTWAILELSSTLLSGVFGHVTLTQPHAKNMAFLSSLVSAEKIKPVIDRIFLWNEINEAVTYSKTGRAQGKIVITI